MADVRGEIAELGLSPLICRFGQVRFVDTKWRSGGGATREHELVACRADDRHILIFADGEGITERARARAVDNSNVGNALKAGKDGAFRLEH
jgi:hypothetical protein